MEAFCADDAVQGCGARDVIVVSTNAYLKLAPLLGQRASLEVSLADGSRTRFDGDISQVSMLGSEGGFARYRLRLSPWIWRLSQVRNSRIWQDKPVTDIVDAVFGAYSPLARWRWSDDALQFMQGAAPRSYCCQYRESDLDFVQRLLAEEGLMWRFEQDNEGAMLVLFADSRALTGVPDDASSPGAGVRFHGARAGEQNDTVQALQARRTIGTGAVTLASYDYKSKKSIVANSPSRLQGNAALEEYDVPGQYAFADAGQARRYADIQMEGHEARSQPWRGRSTVRTLRAGRAVWPDPRTAAGVCRHRRSGRLCPGHRTGAQQRLRQLLRGHRQRRAMARACAQWRRAHAPTPDRARLAERDRGRCRW